MTEEARKRVLVDARAQGLFVVRVPGNGCALTGFVLRVGLDASASTIRASMAGATPHKTAHA